MPISGLFGPPNVNKLKGKRDLKGLVSALNYKKDYLVRCAAAEALGETGEAATVAPLIKALNDSKWPVRQSSAMALGEIRDERAVEPLIGALGKCELDECKSIFKALGKLGDARATRPLIEAFCRESDKLDKDHSGMFFGMKGQLRLEVNWAVAQFGQAAIQPLLDSLRDRNSHVGRVSAEMLEMLGWRPGSNETGAWYWIARRDWKKCLLVGAAAIGPLRSVLEQEPKGHTEVDYVDDPKSYGSFYDGVSAVEKFLPNPEYLLIQNVLAQLTKTA